jgi:hypothetical protein
MNRVWLLKRLRTECIQLITLRASSAVIPAGSRPSGGTLGPEAERVLPLHLPPFPSHGEVFGTARSGPGRAGVRGGGESFAGLKKFSGADPGRRGRF